ncbi:UDP-glucuronate 5-epimerase [Sphingobium amiense]|uniref:UDP-glucuronate 5-epimerase n=1 Tax=Sphingobium amiense TaxID=135719 RepID=A0A494W8R7_9SPHN|nr:NAD-dependent epimerase/dehydratase family protein [Sphingobium amiense]BBD99726.1 UDP-glucuronate 5-epimerase [Sphingobium amiense]
MKKIFVTGSAGFIGFHLCELLLQQGFDVVGYDGVSDYYDVELKRRRHELLGQHARFRAEEGLLEDQNRLRALCEDERPEIIVHLAGQAGVRYSLDNPRAYLESNIVGTFNVMECARELGVNHLLMASTSSVYGGNVDMPYAERDKADMPLTFYAATKKANEAMSHSYAHLWKMPVTMFRFFTVYGPWGRPDMALFKFTQGILEGQPIDVYNHGEMYRDFTYVEDLVRGIRLLIDVPPPLVEARQNWHPVDGDTLSPVAPWRVVNIGNSDKVKLTDFIDAIESECGKPAIRNYMEMQKGDVPATWADASLLRALTGYAPETPVAQGVKSFVRWYRDYYAAS